MNRLVLIFSTFLLVYGCTSVPEKKDALISKINKEMSSLPTALGGVGDEKLEIMPVNELSSMQLKYQLRDQNGWTILTPSEDSRLMYVSNSEGDDATAKAYNISEVSDVFDPSYISAFKTIAAASKLTRDGYPDWILLKKGDEWVIDKSLKTHSGRSASEPMVLTAYSSGDSQRPLIKTKGVDGFQVIRNKRFFSIIGLKFYAFQRDPNSIDFVGWGNVKGSSGFVSASCAKCANMAESIVLENNVFSFYATNIVFSGKSNKNIIVRRNQILNAYSATGHSQGIFVSTANIIFEENLMDHNGWFKQSYVRLNDKAEGQATFFNHNAYFEDIKDSIIINNISSRSSSIGMKFSSNSDELTGLNTSKVYNLLIDNNLFIEGEIGVSLGGNVDFNNGYRWKNINVLNNVFLNIGHGQPTSRTLSLSIAANDWESGNILKNYLLFNDNDNVRNVTGIVVKGKSKDILIDSNVLYKINTEAGMDIRLLDKEPLKNIVILRNYIDHVYDNSFSRNDIRSYMGGQGEEESLDAFIVKAKELSKGNWNKTYTAEQVNKYLKVQFD